VDKKHIIKNNKIILSVGAEMIFFSYNVIRNKELIYQNQTFSLYFSNKSSCYLLLMNIGLNYDELLPVLDFYLSDNKIHILFSAESSYHLTNFINDLNFKYKTNNLSYTIGLICGEMFHPDFVNTIDTKRLNGVITSAPKEIRETINRLDISNNLINYFYTFLFFYYSVGYYLGVEDNVIIDNTKIPKIFYYSKNITGKHKKTYIELIQKEIPKELLYEKKYNNKIKNLDEFLKVKINHFITSYFDYSICMFNLVVETNTDSEFLTEKTLKVILSNTPSFLVVNDVVYQSLTDYGFYFLNYEFEGNNIEETLNNFIYFTKNCNIHKLKELYDSTKNKSIHNRNLLINYIHSEKLSELEYLINI